MSNIFTDNPWNARDTFQEALGSQHPMIGEVPFAAPVPVIRDLCCRYGFEHHLEFHPFHRDFKCGDPVIWLLAERATDEIGAFVFCRDPQMIVDGQQRGDWIIAGYVLVEERS